MPRFFARARLGVAAAVAFAGGILFASAFNLTPFGYAQQGAVSTRPSPQAVKPVADVSNAFVSIAEHITPAVVSIETQRTEARRRGQQRQRGAVPPGLEELFEQFDPNRRPQPAEGSGSGFIVSPDGYILTNNHVVADADRVNVTLNDKRIYRAKVVGRDPTTDVAVIKIDGTNFPTVTMGNDNDARIGEWVLAVGNPLGLDFTVTAGIISAKGRSGSLAQLYRTQLAIVDYIQTDAAINPGNSGGPLVNIRGEVIGINSAIASSTGYYSGYGFAVPITLAKTVMEDLIAEGRVRRAVIGVTINEVRPEDAESAGLREIRGALVGGFSENSPAKRAGLEPGDVIISIDGKPIDRVATLQRIVREHKPGETIELEVMRYGERRRFRVALTEAPGEELVARADRADTAEPETVSYDKLGITVEPVPADLARQAKLSEKQRGLLVTDVDAQSAAFRRLFPRNDIILEVIRPGPRREVRSVADLERALARARSGDIVSLYVLRLTGTGEPQTTVVNLRVGE